MPENVMVHSIQMQFKTSYNYNLNERFVKVLQDQYILGVTGPTWPVTF